MLSCAFPLLSAYRLAGVSRIYGSIGLANSRLSTVALVLTFLATNTGIVNVVDEIEKISGAAEELQHRSFEVLHTYPC
jgi:hypothetical protein